MWLNKENELKEIKEKLEKANSEIIMLKNVLAKKNDKNKKLVETNKMLLLALKDEQLKNKILNKQIEQEKLKREIEECQKDRKILKEKIK